MTQADRHSAKPQNSILASLPASDLEQLRPLLVPVSLVGRQVLAELGQPGSYVYFIERGIASVIVKPLAGEEGVQVAMIGREGLAGDPASRCVLQSACARTVMHMPGAALRISTRDLQHAFEHSPALHAACRRSARNLMAQIMQTSSSNARRSLLERCARWLMMTHERSDGDDIHITHEGLSAMLGIGRPSITVAAATLQQAGLIKIGRGRLTVLDRVRLSSVASGAALIPSDLFHCDDRDLSQRDGWMPAMAPHGPERAVSQLGS